MKKIWKALLALACTATLCVGFAGCNDAASAYDIAVKNGFVGTEAEWLRSLEGADGEDGEALTATDLYETAKANGFTGSYEEFCSQVLEINVQEDNSTTTIAKNIMSTVSVNCGFTQTTGNYPNKKTTPYISAGSGVIIDLDKENGNALVVTNYHVLYDASSDQKGISDCIYLYLFGSYNNFTLDAAGNYAASDDGIAATYVGGAMEYDIALLSIGGSETLMSSAATEAELADSDNVHEGEKVFAIGNANGAGISVTSGDVSVVSEYLSMYLADGKTAGTFRVMRTDAAINHGNSGGGLYNAKGELVGITNAKNVDDEVDNMGYALPISQVKAVCDNIYENNVKAVKRAMLGIKVQTTGSSAAFDEEGHLRVTEEFRVVTAATSESDAAYNKLKENDVFKWIQITTANGAVGEKITLTRQYQLNDLLLTVRKGDTVRLGVTSDGTERTETIVYDRDSYFTLCD